MQSKLLLSLWLAGGLLYAGSTVFLANTLLGGNAPDKSLSIAANENAQCAKDAVAAAQADETKTAALQAKPEPAPAKQAAAPKPEAAEAPAEPDTAAPHGGEADAGQPMDQPLPPDAAGMDPRQGPYPEGPYEDAPWARDQAGMQPDGPAEADEWAHVIASTADMRSEPSLQSQMIYALPAGWQVRVISRQAGWVQVQDANSGASGWVEATAIAPVGPDGRAGGYGRNPQGPYGDPRQRYADEGYPPPPWERRRERRGEFGNFLGRVFGGF